MPPRLVSLDELRGMVGQSVAVSGWLTVDQARINAFAQVTGDTQWIHVDPDRARAESPFGATIAHGFLTLSLLSQLHLQSIQLVGDFARAINYGLNRVRFPAPVRADSRIRSHSELLGIDEQAEHVQLTWRITMEVEGAEKPALVAEWLVRHYRG